MTRLAKSDNLVLTELGNTQFSRRKFDKNSKNCISIFSKMESGLELKFWALFNLHIIRRNLGEQGSQSKTAERLHKAKQRNLKVHFSSQQISNLISAAGPQNRKYLSFGSIASFSEWQVLREATESRDAFLQHANTNGADTVEYIKARQNKGGQITVQLPV